MSATIKDVAKLAGVSPSTVSRTCSNHPSISEQTKQKVRQAMEDLGYKPNFQASSLANRNSRTIGVILPVSESEVYQNSFYLETIRGIGKFCNQKQYMNTLVTSETDEELLQAVHAMFNAGQVEGFIILYSKDHDPVISYMEEKGILYVLIGKAYQNPNQTLYVDNDNILAAREATTHLIKLGHQKIAYLGSDSSHIFARDRRSGYMLALAEHQIPYREDYYIEEPHPTEPTPALSRLLTGPDAPTAVVVSDDILAMSLGKLCGSIGIHIPDQLSVISFNNSLFSRLTSPQLTSVDINSYQLGIEAALQIINHIENPSLPATKTIVPHRIIERHSCSEAPRQNPKKSN